MVRGRNGSKRCTKRIVDHRVGLAGLECRVRWCGWLEECDDWIHYTKTDCREAIKEYWQTKEKEAQAASTPKKRSHDETFETEGSSKCVSSQEPKRNTPPTAEAPEKSEELENEAAEDIAEQIDADEEEDDLERDDRS